MDPECSLGGTKGHLGEDFEHSESYQNHLGEDSFGRGVFKKIVFLNSFENAPLAHDPSLPNPLQYVSSVPQETCRIHVRVPLVLTEIALFRLRAGCRDG